MKTFLEELPKAYKQDALSIVRYTTERNTIERIAKKSVSFRENLSVSECLFFYIFLPRKHTRGNRHWRKKLYLLLKPWEWEILLKRTKLTSLQISCMTVSLEFFSVPCQILFIFAIFVFHFYCHGRLRSCKSLEYCFISS